MAVNIEAYQAIKTQLESNKVTLVAVSKTKPVEDILTLYELGQRHFGENYVQELLEKKEHLPSDIHWHFIGHLQTNKVKYIAPFVYLIHVVDSIRLLKEIDKEAIKNKRKIECLLQIHIAKEATKFGLDNAELSACINLIQENLLSHISVKGLMGMASLTSDEILITNEFAQLKKLFIQSQIALNDQNTFDTLSMGMSSDYNLAMANGSNMVRVGSLLFGERLKK
jgi:PLP dependent protein